jgi:transposase
MMGRLNHDQGEFFYSFCLDEAVPDDHPVRAIAAVLDLSWVHAELAPFYPKIGRPSIDPVLMIRMLIVGYAFAIRSERALCREMRVNLAYRWFCGLSIEDKIPDHSAFSRIRHERFRESDMFRRVFERVVEACIAAGLVGGEGFAVDASLIVADANKQRSIPGTEWKKTCLAETASRATREYLATLDDAAFGAASDVTPKFVSPSDPAAQWTGAMRGPAFFAYADNCAGALLQRAAPNRWTHRPGAPPLPSRLISS